jgi:hypothetical protein
MGEDKWWAVPSTLLQLLYSTIWISGGSAGLLQAVSSKNKLVPHLPMIMYLLPKADFMSFMGRQAATNFEMFRQPLGVVQSNE